MGTIKNSSRFLSIRRWFSGLYLSPQFQGNVLIRREARPSPVSPVKATRGNTRLPSIYNCVGSTQLLSRYTSKSGFPERVSQSGNCKLDYTPTTTQTSIN
ncbi:hypothetical protein J6590_074980 [Homalodisca vitripennis]|nr:hypothetical protein J6590_074980 [Homalodisca vitripennis]